MPLKKIGELVIDSRLEKLAEVDRFTEKIVKETAIKAEDLDDIAISVSEAVNNAMEHGNKLDEKRKVKLKYYISTHYLRIVVQDEGKGFKPNNIPDPCKEENLLKASGRGILIIHHLMDRVSFESYKTGMQIIMEKDFIKESSGEKQ